MITDSLPSIPDVETHVQSAVPPTFEQLYEQYYPHVCRYVRSFGWEPETSEDVLQTILLNIWRGLPSLAPNPYYNAWITRIAKNACIDEIRRRTRARQYIAIPDERCPLTITCPDAYPALEQLADYYSAWHVLSLQEACYLYYTGQGWTVAQLARTFDLPVKLVYMRLLRARQRLRREMNRECRSTRTRKRAVS